MSAITLPRILIIGSIGQVGSKTIDFLLVDKSFEIIAAVRTYDKAAGFRKGDLR
jgi:NAD(P)H dehydrogenase (quinone)